MSCSRERYKFYFKDIDSKTFQTILNMIPYPYTRVIEGTVRNKIVSFYAPYENMLVLYEQIKEFLGWRFVVKRIS